MQTSIKWLLQNDLISKEDKKYSLTESGIKLIVRIKDKELDENIGQFK